MFTKGLQGQDRLKNAEKRGGKCETNLAFASKRRVGLIHRNPKPTKKNEQEHQMWSELKLKTAGALLKGIRREVA